MDADIKTIDLADFAANLARIMDDLDRGTATGFDIVKDGKPLATVRSPRKSLYGLLRGTVELPQGFDATAPVLEDVPHAESGRLHE